MALLTRINDRPLYSTVQEATAWATSRGLTGFHTHTYQGQIGYMGGATHSQATSSNTNINNLPNARSSSGGNGSSGGGY